MSELRTPSKILEDLDQARAGLLNRILSTIADKLEKEFTGKGVEVWIYEYETKVRQVWQKLEEALDKKGWAVTFQGGFDSQKDGPATKLLVLPKVNTGNIS